MNADVTLARPARILLVEDNAADVELTREGFEQARAIVNISHVENGKQCMEFLRKEGCYADSLTPDLILLDLHMPVMDGRQVLAEMAKDDKLRHLPVVVLTTSRDEHDVLESYKLRCSGYVKKPVNFTQFQRVINKIGTYWFTVVALPPNE